MNDKRRTECRKIIKQLNTVYDALDKLQDEERSTLEAFPGNIQHSSRGECILEDIGDLENASDCVSEALNHIQEAMKIRDI